MKERHGKKSISGIAALILLAVFAIGILSVLLTGAGVYKRLADQNAASYDVRTCMQYLANKIRQAPASDAVVVSEFGDGDSLLIREYIGESEYWTQVYCYDGWLMELFTVADGGFAPADGERILPIEHLSVSIDGSLLQIAVLSVNGEEDTLLLTVRGERQGGYEE